MHQDNKGKTTPLRFRYTDDSYSEHVIKNIITVSYEELIINKKREIRYVCKAVIRDCLKIFELKFDVQSCTWVLYKF